MRDVLGLEKPTEEEIFEERDARMRGEYVDLIQSFPDKIDQLLNALNRVIHFHSDQSFVYLAFLSFRFTWTKDGHFV